MAGFSDPGRRMANNKAAECLVEWKMRVYWVANGRIINSPAETLSRAPPVAFLHTCIYL